MSLTVPEVIGHMVAPDAQAHTFLGNPEVGQYVELVPFIDRRKHQHKGCDVSSGGEVQPSIAGPAF